MSVFQTLDFRTSCRDSEGEPKPPDPTSDEQKSLVLHHYDLVCSRFGVERGTLLMRKFACSYARHSRSTRFPRPCLPCHYSARISRRCASIFSTTQYELKTHFASPPWLPVTAPSYSHRQSKGLRARTRVACHPGSPVVPNTFKGNLAGLATIRLWPRLNNSVARAVFSRFPAHSVPELSKAYNNRIVVW